MHDLTYMPPWKEASARPRDRIFLSLTMTPHDLAMSSIKDNCERGIDVQTFRRSDVQTFSVEVS